MVRRQLQLRIEVHRNALVRHVRMQDLYQPLLWG